MNPLIQLKNITRQFTFGETTIEALRGISLDIYQNEFLAIWGPSGSGKSTLMNIIGLIDMCTSGEILFNNQYINTYSDDMLTIFRGKKIGFVFQNFNLVPVLSALENVMLPLQLRKRNKWKKQLLNDSDKQIKQSAMAALIDVGLEKFITLYPDKLSGGQRQRVAIARALVISPKVVIADEPTANLDSETSQTIIKLMREMNRTKNVTFIFTTHDPRLLVHVDRKILIKDGRIESDEIIQ